eukprot:m.65384 g.65384  ORF g.65384 m.65384 type:complete len:468 (-) comp7319_c0_seq2:293-1696(-)
MLERKGSNQLVQDGVGLGVRVRVDEEVLQAPLQRLEARPLLGVRLPAVQHDLVERLRRAGRRGHAVAALDLLQHLGVGHAGVGDAAVRDELREQNTKRPHIRLDGEPVHHRGLGGGPLDGELGALLGRVLVLILDEARQTEVADLADVVLADEDVTCSKITVDKVLQLEVGHARGDLGSHIDELGQAQGLALVVQVVEQAAVLHQLADNVEGHLVRADGKELDQLGVAQTLHHGSLLQEVGRLHRSRLKSLDGDRGGAVPHPLPHIAELAGAQLAQEPDRLARDFPLVLGAVGQTDGGGHVGRLARLAQRDAQTIRGNLVVCDELVESLECDAAGDEEVSIVHAADVVVLDRIALLHRERVVSRLALTLTDEEAAVVATEQKNLLGVRALDLAVEPVLGLDGLHFRDVVAGNKALLAVAQMLSLPPVAVALVEDTHMVTLFEGQIIFCTRGVVVERDVRRVIHRGRR